MDKEVLIKNFQPPPPPKDRILDFGRKIMDRLGFLFPKIKNPKILTVLVLALMLAVIASALILIAKTRQKDDFKPAETVITLPEAQESPPPMSEIEAIIDNFSKQVNDNESYQKKLSKPIVDLDLNFNK